MSISFKGAQHPKRVILFYLRYLVSYRDLDEIRAERGVQIEHSRLNRLVVRHAPLLADQSQARKRATEITWRADETYIKVRGKWAYLFRAFDQEWQTLDFASRTFGSCNRNGVTCLRHGGSSRK